MRLYTIVDNDLYLDEVMLNSAINASIKPRDFADGSNNTQMAKYVDRFLYYTNRENWAEDCETEEKEHFIIGNDSKFLILSRKKDVPPKNAIYCFTSLFIDKNFFLADNEVLISFEVNDKDVLLLDREKYIEYTQQVDQVKSDNIDSIYTARKLREYFDSVEKNALSYDNFFNTVAFVKEVPCNSVKLAYITKNNPLTELLQTSKNALVRRIPMLYTDRSANNKVKRLLKHKPNNNYEKDMPKFLNGKISEEQNNVFWYSKRKV